MTTEGILNMEEKEREAYPGRSGQMKSNPRLHELCQKRLSRSVTKSKSQTLTIINLLALCTGSYVRFMLDAMKKVGW